MNANIKYSYELAQRLQDNTFRLLGMSYPQICAMRDRFIRETGVYPEQYFDIHTGKTK